MTSPQATTALIVIDVQESFRHRPYWSETDLPVYLERQQALIDGCAARGVPVVQVFHNEGEGVFSRDSGFVRTLEGIRIAPDFIVDKWKHSALAGSRLGTWLQERGIRKVIVSGIRTEQCCETTTRAASDAGFSVDYVTEATLTFPMTHAGSGRIYSPAEIKERTELVLAGRFARIAIVEDALAAL
ncbi:hydrolase [Pandoraea terrae]|uniref:Hydrolase n=1 Tax=Pandoraea terrae TaxID=1537710 RepID=A0A5E4ZCR9_9BURK|nr:isochorismatase family protein [Pandoraea terrae]VVE58826.1 hydrolase [Pandoraea terrae]